MKNGSQHGLHWCLNLSAKSAASSRVAAVCTLMILGSMSVSCDGLNSALGGRVEARYGHLVGWSRQAVSCFCVVKFKALPHWLLLPEYYGSR